MKFRSALVFVAAILPLFTASAVAKETSRERQIREIFERSPDDIMPLIQVSGDAMDPVYKVSTYGVSKLVSKGLLGSTSYENSFLRGFVNKSDGKISIQIYHAAMYSGSAWYFLQRATYQDTDSIKEVELDRLGSDVSCYRYGCTYTEDVAFNVPLETIERMAAQYDPANNQKLMRYRLFGKSGNTIDEAIPLNEVAAFALKIKQLSQSVKK